MTYFAPVAPLAYLEDLCTRGKMPDAHLFIAPIVLEQADDYVAFNQLHSDLFVILDNGIIEQGYPLPAKYLYQAMRLSGAQIVVMPDAIDDAAYTVKLTAKALSDYRELDSKTDTMGVVQGTTYEECVRCANDLIEIGVDWLGVPRGLTKNLGSRIRLVQSLSEHLKPIHILGFSDNIQDDILAATVTSVVRGIDAATPVWLAKTQALDAMPGQPPPTDAREWGSRPKDYWAMKPTGALEGAYVAGNIAIVELWLNAARTARTAQAGPVDQADHWTHL